jgi:hypothetical protein
MNIFRIRRLATRPRPRRVARLLPRTSQNSRMRHARWIASCRRSLSALMPLRRLCLLRFRLPAVVRVVTSWCGCRRRRWTSNVSSRSSLLTVSSQHTSCEDDLSETSDGSDWQHQGCSGASASLTRGVNIYSTLFSFSSSTFPFSLFFYLSENRRTDDARRRSARTVSSKSAADVASLDAARCRRRAELEPTRLLSHTDNFR